LNFFSGHLSTYLCRSSLSYSIAIEEQWRVRPFSSYYFTANGNCFTCPRTGPLRFQVAGSICDDYYTCNTHVRFFNKRLVKKVDLNSNFFTSRLTVEDKMIMFKKYRIWRVLLLSKMQSLKLLLFNTLTHVIYVRHLNNV